MSEKPDAELVIKALDMAYEQRGRPSGLLFHSDQGSQYSSSNWRSFLKANNLVASMSRRGNCHDNAVAKSFFQLLKQERNKRKIYSSREDALVMCSITLRRFKTQNAGMVSTISCHR
jgi:putative transposase